MKRSIIAATFLVIATAASAQENNGTDPTFWCDISRSQVSHERDAALAQIERLKIVNARLDERIKVLEAASKKPQTTEGQPNE